MGFLDRLVSDLIQDNTGIPARRLVRMVGGKNILLAGAGAAIAGGLAAKMQQQNTAGGQAMPPHAAPSPGPPGAPPPPPPGAPGAAATPPPPLPPVPQAPGPQAPPEAATAPPAEVDDAEDTELPPELTYAIVRTMVAAALADGHLASEEKEVIHRHLGDSGLTEEQKGQIHQDLVLPPSPAELAALVSSAEEREAAYRFGALIIMADGEAADLERSWLERLADAFEMTAERKQALEAETLTSGGSAS